jgi:hypothetical protein
MAARTRKIRHDDETRARIQTSQLINRLHDHVTGKIELSSTQVRAAEILLKKTIPDLSSAENTTEVVHRYVARLPEKAKSIAEWQNQNSQKTIQ